MNDVYIHYGHAQFNPVLFKPIQNYETPFTKPRGGLWASRINAEYGWKDWCEREGYAECRESNSFRFTLKENANVLKINTVDDLRDLPKIKSQFSCLSMWVLLDYEKLLSDGYDAIEVTIYNNGGLYYALYGWDCDSILIMNPAVIEPCTERMVIAV
jgi:hypothetical protein